MAGDNNNNNDTILHISVTAIKEDKQYSSLLFPTDKKEYETLKKDIADNGIKVPLVINDKNILLDGYTRLRIAKELGLKTVPCIVKCFNDTLEEQLFILTVNAYRRHLNTAQLGEIVVKLLEIEQKISKQRSLMNLKQYNSINNSNNNNNNYNTNTSSVMTNIDHFVESPEVRYGLTSAKTRDKFAKLFKLSNKTIDKIRKIKEVASKDAKIAEFWQEALEGKRSIQAVYDKVKQREAREAVRPIVEDAKMKLTTILNDKVKILYGDFRYVLKDIPDNSIDLIFTDPPYSVNNLDLVNELFMLASRVLKPTGFLAVMYGQDHLDRFFQTFNNTNSNTLRYYWTIALHLPDSNELLASKNVEICWKPIIIFQKLPAVRVEHRFKDYISEHKPKKDIHEWKQDLKSVMHVINALTKEGDVVLDPMVGSGTTIEASIILNRRVIAVEKDKELYELLIKRYHKNNQGIIHSSNEQS